MQTRQWQAFLNGAHAAWMGNGNPYRKGSKLAAEFERGFVAYRDYAARHGEAAARYHFGF